MANPRCLLLLFASLLCTCGAAPRSSVSPTTGIRDALPQVHAIVGACVIPRPGVVLDSATVVFRDGRIEAVGPSSKIHPPRDARIWDGTGRTVYAGLIEPFAHVGLPSAKQMREQANSHWNVNVRAELRAAQVYHADAAALTQLRELGFTAALVVPTGGLFHGQSALVSTSDSNLSPIMRADVAHHVAIKSPATKRSTWEEVTYPGSLMGAVALLRQTWMDASWYARTRALRSRGSSWSPLETSEALEVLSAATSPKKRKDRDLVILEVPNERMLRVAAELVDEFGLRIAVRGGGAEYRQLDRIAQLDVPMILPVNFPSPPDVSDIEDGLATSLSTLWHWEAAPGNAAHVRTTGVPVALTTDGLSKLTDFPARMRSAMEHGLSADDALAALTTVPARLLGVDDELGTIEAGHLAHLVVTDGDLFAQDTEILEVWIDGERHRLNDAPDLDLRGDWSVQLQHPTAPAALGLHLSGKTAHSRSWKGALTQDSLEVPISALRLEGQRLGLSFSGDSLGVDGVFRLSGRVAGDLLGGDGEDPQGLVFAWSATRTMAEADSISRPVVEADAELAMKSVPLPPFPPVSYATTSLPARPRSVLVRNATIWTSGAAGVLESADLLVRDGKVKTVGFGLKAPAGASIIDATGKHVTPGLVDAHVHITAMGGLNEWTQAISAEVRVRDVLNAYDGRIYRHMAQGTTTVHVMHGSSNPIGGQNATIKLRWGQNVEGLLLKGAAATIKFALGENVKHANRGTHFTTRYPQTRMGVAALIRDRLAAAQEYRLLRQSDKSVRQDLELDAIVEVLAGKRLVHCHSYRQDEILALIRIADEFDFTVGTFQHVMEGYKVADVIAEHGARASTFSDWWGYKFEVLDAIPYNAALMHAVGVGVSLNSDLSNYGGRIHVDAAKAVKYGGVPPAQALHMVTIEPARQLGVDHLVGSLEPGKDADFVIWSGSPLSSYTRCEQTWIDGRRYFDLDDDAHRRKHVTSERNRLIQAILAEGEQD